MTKRPVWLFSMDSDQFRAPPTTTAGLLAYFRQHGATQADTDVELVHFQQEGEVGPWLVERWDADLVARAREAASAGQTPVVGFSCYTWNTDVFLVAMAHIKASCPEVTVIVGGPQVQTPEDYLSRPYIDVIALGECEVTFQEWLDADGREHWKDVHGLAFREGDGIVQTPERPRETALDRFPSPLEVLDLRDADGTPRYTQVAYETSRGCPFRCAYCEWGTGAIGTKMYQFSLDRVRADMEGYVAGGIQDIWLSDSNFGALREDLDKTRIIVELRERTGLPNTFATSWSKSHNDRVQEIVLLLQQAGLLQNYNLALQTLTPLALKLSNRTNMRSNRYEPIAKAMTREGVPIATELIWGLPGDNLAEFETNLDRLLTFFPNINIFGYTLLPGTEFYDKREEYRIQTIPVAGYGKAKGEYVVGCHTFDRDEGLEGYFLITAHIVLIRGHIMPFTVRLLALDGGVPVSPLLRTVLRSLLDSVAPSLPNIDFSDRMAVYEHRAEIYLALLGQHEETFEVLRDALRSGLAALDAPAELRTQVAATLALDEALCPRTGKARVVTRPFAFDVHAIEEVLGKMERPEAQAFEPTAPVQVSFDHPAHAGEILRDPDGGSWMRGKFVPAPEPA